MHHCLSVGLSTVSSDPTSTYVATTSRSDATSATGGSFFSSTNSQQASENADSTVPSLQTGRTSVPSTETTVRTSQSAESTVLTSQSAELSAVVTSQSTDAVSFQQASPVETKTMSTSSTTVPRSSASIGDAEKDARIKGIVIKLRLK